MSRLVNKNIQSSKGRTSMRMEPEFWTALDEIVASQNVSLAYVIQYIEGLRKPDEGFTSAVRVYILTYFRKETRR